MTEKKTERINIRVTPALLKRFDAAREQNGHTLTDALIMLISRYCDEAEREKKN